MKAQRMLQAPEIVLCSLLLIPALLSSQRPPAPGKLSVTSTPSGATITIDNQSTGKETDFTFVVSPGDHSVSVKKDALPNCVTKMVTVTSGSVVLINCTATGWGAPTRVRK